MKDRTRLFAVVSFICIASVACAGQGGTAPATATKAVAPTAADAKSAPASSVAEKSPAPASTAAGANASTKPEPASLTVGSTQLVSDAGTFIAIERGYFAEQGLTVKVENFRATTDMVPPLSTGQVDVAMIPMSAATLQSADHGVDIKLVADKGTTMPNFEYVWILLRKDLADSGQVKTPADLKGMKIAIPSVASLGEQTVQIMIEQAGLKTSDVDIEVVAFADQPAAFANKALAASYGVEPLVTRAVEGNFAVKWIPNSKYFNDKLDASTIYYGSALIKNRDLGQRFMIAYLKGVRDYMKAFTTGEGRDEITNILVKYTTVKEAPLYSQMEMPYVDPNGAIDLDSQEAQFKWFIDKGLYKGNKSFNDLVDPSYVEYAVQKLGKWQAR